MSQYTGFCYMRLYFFYQLEKITDKHTKNMDEFFCNLIKTLNRMTESKMIGNKGEEIASQYLENKGYQIIARNWQYMHRELDIVAVHQKELIFVEVKTRLEGSLLSPIEAVTLKKQKLLVHAADLFIQKHNLDFEVRFDIISIIYSQTGFQIEHIENAFYPRVK